MKIWLRKILIKIETICVLILPISTVLADEDKVVFDSSPLKTVEETNTPSVLKSATEVDLKGSLAIDLSSNYFLLLGEDFEEAHKQMDETINSYNSIIQEITEKKEQEAKEAEEKAKQTQEVSLSGVYSKDVWTVANSLVGTPGDCFYIARLFYYYWTGTWTSFGNVSQTTSPSPGDLIFYANGGKNTTHYAIYLGEDQSLQGNWDGTTIIHSVYINGATDPIYYHVN